MTTSTDPAAPRYEEVARAIQAQIGNGTLRPDDRLPSIRQIKATYAVGINTAIHAYSLLEERGLIESRPKSGFYVRRPPNESLPRPPRRSTRSLHVEVESRIARLFHSMRDTSVAPLAAATIATELLPARRLAQITSRLARWTPERQIGYDPLPGRPELRLAVARRASQAGCLFSPEEVVVTVGAIEAIALCLRAVTTPGGIVAVESPTYFGVLKLVESLGLRAVEVSTSSETGMDLIHLDMLLARHQIQACVVLPNFGNPAGGLMPDAAKKSIVDMLARALVPLIESDVYGDLMHSGERPRPLKAFDQTGNVMLCSSVSKTLAPGLRVGWAVPGRFFNAVEALKFTHTVATAGLPQAVVAEFISGSEYDRHLRRLRAQLCEQVGRYADALSQYCPLGTRVSRPRGGFLLWVEFPQGTDVGSLQAEVLQAGVGVAPGPIFSVSESSFKNYIRISCGSPWSPKIAAALETVGRVAALKTTKS